MVGVGLFRGFEKHILYIHKRPKFGVKIPYTQCKILQYILTDLEVSMLGENWPVINKQLRNIKRRGQESKIWTAGDGGLRFLASLLEIEILFGIIVYKLLFTNSSLRLLSTTLSQFTKLLIGILRRELS